MHNPIAVTSTGRPDDDRHGDRRHLRGRLGLATELADTGLRLEVDHLERAAETRPTCFPRADRDCDEVSCPATAGIRGYPDWGARIAAGYRESVSYGTYHRGS